MAHSSQARALPIQFTQLDLSDFQTHEGIAKFNNILSQIQTTLNNVIGAAGPTTLSSGIDVAGSTVSNLGEPRSPSDAISKMHAERNYSAQALAPQLESGSSVGLKTYRALNSKSQQESYSTFLNKVMNTAPTCNSSTMSATVPSGGSVMVTVTGGYHYYVDGSNIVPYAARTDTLPVPGSGNYVYYYYIRGYSQTLALSPQFTADTQQNRLSINTDGTVLIAVAVINASGLDKTQSAAGATPPSDTSNFRLLTRL